MRHSEPIPHSHAVFDAASQAPRQWPPTNPGWTPNKLPMSSGVDCNSRIRRPRAFSVGRNRNSGAAEVPSTPPGTPLAKVRAKKNAREILLQGPLTARGHSLRFSSNAGSNYTCSLDAERLICCRSQRPVGNALETLLSTNRRSNAAIVAAQARARGRQ